MKRTKMIVSDSVQLYSSKLSVILDEFVFHMRFPRDEWNNALKYYRPISKLPLNSIATHELSDNKKHNEEKENVSDIFGREINA